MYLKLLELGVREGIINLHLPTGKRYRFGNKGIETNWIIKSEDAIKRIARNWEYQLGETYVNGKWEVADCELRDLLMVLRRNFSKYTLAKWLQPFARLLQQYNRITHSYRNVSHHYDIDEAVFRLFLDREMHYSCGYFNRDNYSLEDAQEAKSVHIAKKLLLKPGHSVLDVGCGWGSLAFYLAKHFDVDVVGITLSRAQLAVARRHAQELHIDNVHFELADYREHSGSYDRIVSVGMFEHVGNPFHRVYFKRINNLLRSKGVALVHTIGSTGPPNVCNPWIRKHIFPGGYIPALSEMSRAAEESEFMITDVEVLRLHYMLTLRCWYDRFQLNRDEIKARMGERFCRMWEFYLSICEIAFQFSDLVVFQMQLAHQHNVVPATRDYLYQ